MKDKECKTWWWIGAVIVMATMLVICATRPATSKVTIEYWTLITDPEMFKEGEGKAIELFKQEYPDIFVKVQQIPFADYDTKVTTAANAGSPPDIARVNHVTLSTWAGAGYLEPLDDLIAKSEIVDPDDYYKGFWSACLYQGKQYALPQGTDCRALYYNIELFKAAGLEPPKTWDELKTTARRLTNPPSYATTARMDNHWACGYETLGPFLVANDGHMVNPEGTKAIASIDKGAIEAFKLVYDELMPYYTPGAVSMNEIAEANLFTKRIIAMFMGGPWMRHHIESFDPTFKFKKTYDITSTPIGPRTGHTGSAQGGWFWGIFAGSRHKAESWKLLEFFERPEIMAVVARPENIPARSAANRLEPWGIDPFWAAFIEELPFSRPPFPLVPELAEISEKLYKYAQETMLGRISVDEALARFDTEVNEYILK